MKKIATALTMIALTACSPTGSLRHHHNHHMEKIHLHHFLDGRVGFQNKAGVWFWLHAMCREPVTTAITTRRGVINRTVMQFRPTELLIIPFSDQPVIIPSNSGWSQGSAPSAKALAESEEEETEISETETGDPTDEATGESQSEAASDSAADSAAADSGGDGGGGGGD